MTCRIMLIFVITYTAFGVGVNSGRCNRPPDGVVPFKSPPGDAVLLEFEGRPESYVPNQRYEITLISKVEPFRRFTLRIENEANDENSLLSDTASSEGTLSPGDDRMSKFSSICPKTIVETNDFPKTEVKVNWIAPPTKSGCIIFKATVVVSREKWFSEDGPLKHRLCEDNQNGGILPPILEECCACSEAKYEMAFEGLWSRNTHPKDFPKEKLSTRFSDVIGASHSMEYTFWSFGDYATDGLRQLFQNGNTRELEKELKDNSKHIRTIIKSKGISYPNITGKTFAVFRVDKEHHLISVISMIFPSPDWFVGISSLELCQRDCSWVESKVLNLFPIDAGVDKGVTYLDNNQPEIPPQPIRLIKTSGTASDPRSPFFDVTRELPKPFARITLVRLKEYNENCQDNTTGVECEYKGEWGPCSVTCGRGVKYKQMYLVSGNEKCDPPKTYRRSCVGTQRNCVDVSVETTPTAEESMCELTDWGEWSNCSESCGYGTMTRSRRYKTRDAAKRCAARKENPPPLEQNKECLAGGVECEGKEREKDCPDNPWGFWSPCSVTCGKGIKVRYRRRGNNPLTQLQAEASQENDLEKLPEEDEDQNFEEEEEGAVEEAEEETVKREAEDACENLQKVVEVVECLNDEKPSCDDENKKFACNMPKEEGLCKSSITRWYFDSITEKCETFTYSGCQGNANNFPTRESCEERCSEYQNIESASLEVPQDCKLGPWGKWTACEPLSGSCGPGQKFKYREIEVFPKNGGKQCEGDEIKVKDCMVKCHRGNKLKNRSVVPKEELCEMSEWSAWSHCTGSCDSSGVEQRTRNIIRRNVENGEPCSARLEERSCNVDC